MKTQAANRDLWRLLASIYAPSGLLLSGSYPRVSGVEELCASATNAAFSVESSIYAERASGRSIAAQNITMLDYFIGTQTGQADFYYNSLSAESGFLDSAQLRCLWQNISTRSVETVEVKALSEVEGTLEFPIDCVVLTRLDSHKLISEIMNWVEKPNLIIARTLLEAPTEGDGALADYKVLERALKPNGYKLLAQTFEPHPRIGICAFGLPVTLRVRMSREDAAVEVAAAQRTLEQATNAMEALEINSRQERARFAQERDRFSQEREKFFREKEKLSNELASSNTKITDSERAHLITHNNLEDLRKKFKTLIEENQALSNVVQEVRSHIARILASKPGAQNPKAK